MLTYVVYMLCINLGSFTTTRKWRSGISSSLNDVFLTAEREVEPKGAWVIGSCELEEKKRGEQKEKREEKAMEGHKGPMEYAQVRCFKEVH